MTSASANLNFQSDRVPALSDIVITGQLQTRVPVHLDLKKVNASLQELSSYVTQRDIGGMLDKLVLVALDVCNAGTAGLSVLERQPDGALIFRWDALAGALAAFRNGTTPRDFSPCGTTLDRRSPQLFRNPSCYFTYFQQANPQILEGLVLPLYLNNGQPYGTLWIATHDPERQFNSEDVRIMESLCSFTMAAARVLNLRPRV